MQVTRHVARTIHLIIKDSEENTFFQKTKKDDASVSVTKRMVAPAAVERLYKQQL